jgi:predicted transcriptional regulator
MNATKVMKVGIASFDEFKARTMAIARGDLRPKADDPKVWFPSTESFARVLLAKNRDLLATINKTHPGSLEELAAHTGRAPSNLSRTLRTMERYGFVTLHWRARGRIRPEVPWQAITLELALS